jgi:hypothetical protein
MKKILAILLALAVVGVFAFADGAAAPAPALSFTGYLNIGGVYGDNAVSGAAATWASQGWDSGTGGRFNLNGKFSGDTFGLAFRLREQDAWTANNTGALYVRRVYGWLTAFDGVVKFNAGRLGDYAWATGSGGGWQSFGSIDGPVGMQVQIKPVDGLNFGAFIPVANVASGKFSDYLSSSIIGAAYYLKGVGDIEGGYNLSPTANAANAWLGLAYTGMKDLTAYGEFHFVAIGNTATGYSYGREYFDYPIGAIDLSLVLMQQIFAASSAGTSLAFSPTLGYTLSPVTKVELNATYATNSGYSKSGWQVSPDVCFTLGKASTLRVGVSYAGGDYKAGDASGGTTSTVEGTASIPFAARVNSLGGYVDFVINF